MRTLIITASLLPISVVVLAIDWVNEITTGEIIAIGLSILIIIGAVIRIIYKQTSPNRAYKMALFDSSIDQLVPKDDSEVSEYIIRQDNIAEVHVRLTVKTGTNVESIRFRLVNRVFPRWRWVVERPGHAFVEKIWDKDWERERTVNPFILSRGSPLYIQDNEVGILYFGNRSQLKGDIVWYRVIIHANTNWEGYLEYSAPSGDGRYAYSRRKIILQSTYNKGGSQPQ